MDEPEQACPACTINSINEVLNQIQEAFETSQDVENNYKASQLNVAFVTAQGNLTILRDLIIEFFGTTDGHEHREHLSLVRTKKH